MKYPSLQFHRTDPMIRVFILACVVFAGWFGSLCLPLGGSDAGAVFAQTDDDADDEDAADDEDPADDGFDAGDEPDAGSPDAEEDVDGELDGGEADEEEAGDEFAEADDDAADESDADSDLDEDSESMDEEDAGDEGDESDDVEADGDDLDNDSDDESGDDVGDDSGVENDDSGEDAAGGDEDDLDAAASGLVGNVSGDPRDDSQVDEDADADDADGRDFELDELLAIDLDVDQIDRAEALGFEVLERVALDGLDFELLRLSLPDDKDALTALRQLRRLDPRGSYDLNQHYRLASAETRCGGIRCYPQALIGAPVGDPSSCAVAGRVAVLDSSVDVSHPALRGARIRSERIGDGPASPADHGTAVATLLVGDPSSAYPGLLPAAELLAADVFSPAREDGAAVIADTARLIQGVDWAVAERAQVINFSLTGAHSPLLQRALQRAKDAGVVLIAAAGNQGPKAPPQYPAAYPQVLAVGAVDRRLKAWPGSASGKHLELTAPGVAVWAADSHGGGRFWDGTSFASPFVAAAAVMLRAQNSDQSAADVIQALRRTARDIGPPGPDVLYGAGLVQWPQCPIRN